MARCETLSGMEAITSSRTFWPFGPAASSLIASGSGKPVWSWILAITPWPTAAASSSNASAASNASASISAFACFHQRFDLFELLLHEGFAFALHDRQVQVFNLGDERFRCLDLVRQVQGAQGLCVLIGFVAVLQGLPHPRAQFLGQLAEVLLGQGLDLLSGFVVLGQPIGAVERGFDPLDQGRGLPCPWDRYRPAVWPSVC